MKTVFVLFGLLLVIVVTISVAQNYLKKNPSFLSRSATITINNHTFGLIVAKTGKEKEIGLSNTTFLPQDKGMLFPFEKADYYSFWMRDMKFPIDMIYIRSLKIITVYQNVPAPKSLNEDLPIYRPDETADMVLEVNAGLSQKYGFKKGDQVKIQNL